MSQQLLDKQGLTYFFQKLGIILAGKIDFYSMTTAEWALQTQMVSKVNTIYIYRDHKTKSDGNGGTIDIAGFKLGDGTSYVVDLPFLNVDEETFNNHVNDNTIHITAAERTFWNNKVTCEIDVNNQENLILSKIL